MHRIKQSNIDAGLKLALEVIDLYPAFWFNVIEATDTFLAEYVLSEDAQTAKNLQEDLDLSNMELDDDRRLAFRSKIVAVRYAFENQDELECAPAMATASTLLYQLIETQLMPAFDEIQQQPDGVLQSFRIRGLGQYLGTWAEAMSQYPELLELHGLVTPVQQVLNNHYITGVYNKLLLPTRPELRLSKGRVLTANA